MAKVYYSAMRNTSISETHHERESGAVVYGYLVLLLGVAVLLIGYIWEYHQVLDLSEQLRQAKYSVVDLQDNNHTMTVEIAALTTRPKIQHIAETQLNLTLPPLQNVVWYTNPTDRFQSFDETNTFFANSEILNKIFTIGSVEARSSD